MGLSVGAEEVLEVVPGTCWDQYGSWEVGMVVNDESRPHVVARERIASGARPEDSAAVARVAAVALPDVRIASPMAAVAPAAVVAVPAAVAGWKLVAEYRQGGEANPAPEQALSHAGPGSARTAVPTDALGGLLRPELGIAVDARPAALGLRLDWACPSIGRCCGVTAGVP